MKNNLYFWHWDPFLIKEKENYWKSSFIEKNSEINLEVFDWNESKMSEVVNAIWSLPFLWDKRLIFIKNIPHWAWNKKINDTATETLIEWLSNIPNTNIVVFISSSPDKRTKLFKHISKLCDTLLLSVDEKNLLSYVKDFVKKQNISIWIEAIRKLIDLTWVDLFKISNELNKLSIYKYWEEILESDVINIVQDTSEVNIFKITNLIASGKKSEALKELQNLLRWGEDIIYVFNLIVRQVRLLLSIYELQNENSSIVARELKVAPFVVSTLKNQIKNFSLDTLLKMHMNLYNIDKRFKTWKLKWDKVFALEIEKWVILAW